ncbi:MAG: hypothetical protein AAB669_01535 [Patescibacteria group bacterium]
MEREPREPVTGESRPEDFVTPQTGDETRLEVAHSGEFVETWAMVEIRARVEQGEELTVELYTTYQAAGEQVVNSFSGNDRNIQNLELQLKCYELQALAGMKGDALEEIHNLIDELPDNLLYAGLYVRAKQAAERIAQNELDSDRPQNFDEVQRDIEESLKEAERLGKTDPEKSDTN